MAGTLQLRARPWPTTSASQTGRYIRTSKVETLAVTDGVYLRRGRTCDPGGIARHLRVDYRMVKSLYASGMNCADDLKVPPDFERPVGMVRVSFGATSSMEGVESLLEFVQKHFQNQVVGYERPEAISLTTSDANGANDEETSASAAYVDRERTADQDVRPPWLTTLLCPLPRMSG